MTRTARKAAPNTRSTGSDTLADRAARGAPDDAPGAVASTGRPASGAAERAADAAGAVAPDAPSGAATARRRRGRPKKMGADSEPTIRRAALKLFADRGYANTSLDDIAAGVGITKGGIYYYFRSKERLLLEILDDIEARSIGETERRIAACTGPARERLALFNDAQAAWASAHPADLAILMLTSIETAGKTSAPGDRVRAIYRRIESLLTGIVDAAKRAGEITAPVATRHLVLELMAIHDGNMLLWFRSGFDAETGRVLSAIAKRSTIDAHFGTATPSGNGRASPRRASAAKR